MEKITVDGKTIEIALSIDKEEIENNDDLKEIISDDTIDLGETIKKINNGEDYE